MEVLDWIIVVLYIGVALGIGSLFMKRAGKSTRDYFVGGRQVPWWIAGVSMVATTFAADTPLAVTGIVSSEGIAGNWIWWNFVLSGMFTVFFFAKLWHRSGVMTDVELAEIRYGGRPASILRGFRALYLAFPINCVILGWVTLGMSKVLQVITGREQWETILVLYGLTAVYIIISGLWGVVVTDVVQFVIAMAGSIVLMFFALNQVDGISGLTSRLANTFGPNHVYLDFSPIGHPKILLSTALVWLGMQWWASWYPGAEPGGGGYIAQRMFSTRTGKDAVKATLLYNVAHYAVRPWPWIITGLVSLVVYPELADPESGYAKLMVDLLPAGLFGLLVVAFMSAFMSTVSTHLNWGASYVVNDFYVRFVRPVDRFESPETAQRHYVLISRLSTLIMAGAAIVISYFFDTVKGGWELILSLGAGTGLVYMLRWFRWRINAWSEISAMLAAFGGSVSAGYLGFEGFAEKMIFTAMVTTVIWVTVTFLTKPETDEILKGFVTRVRPAGPGWRKVSGAPTESIFPMLANVILGAATVLGCLFGVGSLIFGSHLAGYLLLVLAGISASLILRNLGDLPVSSPGTFPVGGEQSDGETGE
ncbi:MAG: sodium:solute symporter family protein [Fidelibacterota bacterium]